MKYLAFFALLTLAGASVAQVYPPMGIQWVSHSSLNNQYDGFTGVSSDGDSGYGFRYRTATPTGRRDSYFKGYSSLGGHGGYTYRTGPYGADTTINKVSQETPKVSYCGAEQKGVNAMDWRAYVGTLGNNSVPIDTLYDGSGRDETLDMVYENGFIYALVRTELSGGSEVAILKIDSESMTIISTGTYRPYPNMNPRRILLLGGYVTVVGDAVRADKISVIFNLRVDKTLAFQSLNEAAANPGHQVTARGVEQVVAGPLVVVGSVVNPLDPESENGVVTAWRATSGILEWTDEVDGPAGLADRFNDVSSYSDEGFSSRTFHVAGTTQALPGDRDFYVVSYDWDGSRRWEADFNQSPDDVLTAAEVDKYGNPVFAGFSLDSGLERQMAFLRLYQVNGTLLTSLNWGATVPGHDSASDMVRNSYGDIMVAGEGVRTTTGHDGLMWRIIHPPVAADDEYTIRQDTTDQGFGPLANDGLALDATVAIVTQPSSGTATMNLISSKQTILYTPNPGFMGTDSMTYRAIRGPFSSAATIRINVVRSARILLAKSTLAGQNYTTGTVLLTSVAPAGGQFVELSTNSSSIVVPPSLTVPAGADRKTFPVNVKPVTSTQVRNIVVVCNGYTASGAQMTLVPLVPSAFAFAPNPVSGGTTVSARLVFNGYAGPGTVVNLSDNSAFCSVPTSVNVPAGASQVNFNVTTSAVGSPQNVFITATMPGGSKSGHLRIVP